MATQRGNFSQLLAPAQLGMMFDWLKEHPEEFSQFLEVQTKTEGAYTEDQIIAGFGIAKLKLESEGVSYDDPIQGGSKRYVPETFGLGWQVTMEMREDDNYDVMSRMPGLLMKSLRQRWEQTGANVLNGAATTTTTADGVSLINTAHPLLGGGTYANRLSVDVDLGITPLQQLIILYENMVDDRGLKVRAEPTDLWIPPDLQFIVGQIFQSHYEPFTGNNAVNTMQGRLNPTILHYLTNPKAYFISSKDLNYAKFIWKKRPDMVTFDDPDTRGTKTNVVARFVAGATDWRGWAGSLP